MTLSLITIGSVILCALFVVSLPVIYGLLPTTGIVKVATYAARDKQSFQVLERAKETRNTDLTALSTNSAGRIIPLEARTRVWYRPGVIQLVSNTVRRAQVYFDLQAVEPRKQGIIKVRIDSGPYKGAVVLINERDVGFYNFL